MRKEFFLGSLSTKMVLAASVVAGLSLTSCEKETAQIVQPTINITVPSPEIVAGELTVAFSAATSNGATLEGVTFTDEDGNILKVSEVYKNPISKTSFYVTASKPGYRDDKKLVVLPTKVADNTYNVINVNFILTAVEAAVEVVPGEVVEGVEPVEVAGTKEYGAMSAGDKILAVETPVGYYTTAEQKQAMYDAVDAITGPVTRAELTDEQKANLQTAKENLKAEIAKLNSVAATDLVNVPFVLKDAASKVNVELATTVVVVEVTLATEVAGETYEVKGEQNSVGNTVYSVTADGVVISHDSHDPSHDGSHGSGSNAGGGFGE